MTQVEVYKAVFMTDNEKINYFINNFEQLIIRFNPCVFIVSKYLISDIQNFFQTFYLKISAYLANNKQAFSAKISNNENIIIAYPFSINQTTFPNNNPCFFEITKIRDLDIQLIKKIGIYITELEYYKLLPNITNLPIKNALLFKKPISYNVFFPVHKMFFLNNILSDAEFKFPDYEKKDDSEADFVFFSKLKQKYRYKCLNCGAYLLDGMNYICCGSKKQKVRELVKRLIPPNLPNDIQNLVLEHQKINQLISPGN